MRAGLCHVELQVDECLKEMLRREAHRKGVAIPEDIRRSTGQGPETKWIHACWATLRTWWSMQ